MGQKNAAGRQADFKKAFHACNQRTGVEFSGDRDMDRPFAEINDWDDFTGLSKYMVLDNAA